MVPEYSVRPGRCIRCAACAILAPGIFAVAPDGARVVRQPVSETERRDARAALLGCPTAAIARTER